MEILHAFGIDYRLLLIQVVNFGVLMLVLWQFLYKPLLKIIDERRGVVEKGVRDAESAAKRLAQAEEEKRTIMSGASKDADAMVERARKEATDRERQAVLDAEAKAVRILKDAEGQSEEMKKKALAEAQEDIAKLVVLGMERAMKSK